MGKSDKIKEIRKALQPKAVMMDRIFIHNPSGEPVFHCELQGEGRTVIVSSVESVKVLQQLNSMQ